jgi:hypothetical protein
MALTTRKQKVARCAYVKVCYLTEAMKCFGYKTDCVLFQKSNGEDCPEQKFHQAMDSLIDKTKAKFEKLT